MPVTIPEAVHANAAAAVVKADHVRSLPRFLALAALAGAYVGIAVVVLVSLSAPLVATANPAAKLVQAAVFGIALTLVVFAGAELFTGNVMVMIHGWRHRRIGAADLVAVWAASLVGNVAGSIALAGVVHAGGTLRGQGAELIAKTVAAKDALAGPQLFWRAVLCNLLVCLALWMATRTASDGAKLALLWWPLLAFIASGFEHSVANVTTFALGVFEGSATWSQLVRNLAWTVPGNLVGGGLLVGALYGWVTPGARRPPAGSTVPARGLVSIDAAVGAEPPVDAQVAAFSSR